jgi:YesN/AraC family two-component response regulator
MNRGIDLDMDILKDISVLYVEDDKEVNDALSRSLRRVCKEVYVAYDGEEGLALYEQNVANIDIVISDIKMPKLNGIEMVKSIKSLNPTQPVIISSAYGETEFINEALESGVASFLLKPVSKARLKELLAFYGEKIVNQTFEKDFFEFLSYDLEALSDPVAVMQGRKVHAINKKRLKLSASKLPQKQTHMPMKSSKGLLKANFKAAMQPIAVLDKISTATLWSYFLNRFYNKGG